MGGSNVTAITVYNNTTSGRLGVSFAWAWGFGWYSARGATTAHNINKTGAQMYILSQLFWNYYSIWRGFMSFNTGASLPSDAIISSASWVGYLYQLNPLHDTTREGVIQPSTQVDATNLVKNDYNNVSWTPYPPTDEIGRLPLDAPGLKTVDFSSSDFSQIKRSGEVSNNGGDEGWTLLCLRGDLDADATPLPTTVDINCSFLQVFVPPSLVVNYTLPPPPPPPTVPGGNTKDREIEKDTSELWEVEASIYSVNENILQDLSSKKKYTVPENKIEIDIDENISLRSSELPRENIIIKLVSTKNNREQ